MNLEQLKKNHCYIVKVYDAEEYVIKVNKVKDNLVVTKAISTETGIISPEFIIKNEYLGEVQEIEETYFLLLISAKAEFEAKINQILAKARETELKLTPKEIEALKDILFEISQNAKLVGNNFEYQGKQNENKFIPLNMIYSKLLNL